MKETVVEAPDVALWHIALDGVTLCDRDARGWLLVLRATERDGVWCGHCLAVAAHLVERKGSGS